MTLQDIAQQLLQAAIDNLGFLIGYIFLRVLPHLLERFTIWYTAFKLSQPVLFQRFLDIGAELAIRAVQKEWENGKIVAGERLDEGLKKFKDYLAEIGYEDIDDSVLRTHLEGLLGQVQTQMAVEKSKKQEAQTKVG